MTTYFNNVCANPEKGQQSEKNRASPYPKQQTVYLMIKVMKVWKK